MNLPEEYIDLQSSLRKKGFTMQDIASMERTTRQLVRSEILNPTQRQTGIKARIRRRINKILGNGK